MTQRTLIGAVCATLMGLAALIGDAPRLVLAQEPHPTQKVPGPAPLAGTNWLLIESSGHHVAQNGLQPHFKLKPLERYQDGSSGQVQGEVDFCGNDLIGTYRAAADRLHFEIDGVAASLRACRTPIGVSTENIGRLLSGNPHFRIHGDELDMLDDNGAVRARFFAATRN